MSEELDLDDIWRRRARGETGLPDLTPQQEWIISVGAAARECGWNIESQTGRHFVDKLIQDLEKKGLKIEVVQSEMPVEQAEDEMGHQKHILNA